MVCQVEEVESLVAPKFDDSVNECASLGTEPSSQEAGAIEHRRRSLSDDKAEASKQREGATVFETSLNIGKLCMGTGTLALPFAAEKGGLIFNSVGLGVICLWNYYSANCLLRCLEFLPQIDVAEVQEGNSALRESCSMGSMVDLEQKPEYGTMNSDCGRNEENKLHAHDQQMDSVLPAQAPENTTTYGAVAWFALGPSGLLCLDLLMMSLYFGLVVAYEVAIQSFISDTPLTTGSKKVDLLVPSAIIAIISSAPDIGFLSKFSGMGLLAVVLSFSAIAWQGLSEFGLSGFRSAFELNSWPANLSAASSWFGVVVFGYGVAPFIFNFRNSMSDPRQVSQCLQIGLSLVYAAYTAMSNGIRVLFSPGGHVFDGDVLQTMPTETWISIVVRLLMAFSVAVTAPLIVVPCGELIEGKLRMEKAQHSSKVVVRVTFCIICTLFAEFISSGFVNIVSFIGCFCVSIVSFILPPLFCIQLSKQSKSTRNDWLGIDPILCDAVMLIVGIIATIITSSLTFRDLVLGTE